MISEDESIFPLDNRNLSSRSVSGAAITSVAQGAKFFLMLASQVVLARLLLPRDFGIIAMVAPALGLATTLADLGLLQAVVQRPVITRRELNEVFWLNIVLSTGLMMALIGLAPILAWIYAEPRLAPVTVAFAVLVLVTGATMLQSALLNRTMNFKALAIAEVTSLSIGLAVGILGALNGLGYWALVLNPLAAGVTSSICLWASSGWLPGKPRITSHIASIFRFGRNLTVSNIALYLNTTLDNMLIGWFNGQTELGLYDRAWKLVVLPFNQLMAPIGRVAVPTLSRLADDPARYRNIFGQMLQIMLLLSVPGLIVAALCSETLIGTVLGAKWVTVAPVFSWLCLGAMITPVNGAVFWIFVSQGRSRDHMVFGSSAAMINLCAYAIGVHWGILGVARTSALSVYALQTPLLVWAAVQHGPVSLKLFGEVLMPFVCMGLVVSAFAFQATTLGLGSSFLNIVLLAGTAYAVACLVLLSFASGRRFLLNIRSVFLLVLRKKPADAAFT